MGNKGTYSKYQAFTSEIENEGIAYLEFANENTLNAKKNTR